MISLFIMGSGAVDAVPPSIRMGGIYENIFKEGSKNLYSGSGNLGFNRTVDSEKGK